MCAEFDYVPTQKWTIDIQAGCWRICSYFKKDFKYICGIVKLLYIGGLPSNPTKFKCS